MTQPMALAEYIIEGERSLTKRQNIKCAYKYVADKIEEHADKLAELEYQKGELIKDYIRTGGNERYLEK